MYIFYYDAQLDTFGCIDIKDSNLKNKDLPELTMITTTRVVKKSKQFKFPEIATIGYVIGEDMLKNDRLMEEFKEGLKKFDYVEMKERLKEELIKQIGGTI